MLRDMSDAVSAFCQGSKCYLLVFERLNAADAHSRCERHGGQLAIVDNANENVLIRKIAVG